MIASGAAAATVGRGLAAASGQPVPNFDVSRNSINRALFGHGLHIFGNKIVGYVCMNIIRTNSVDYNDLITILN